jgi:hypothetical protein
MLRIALIAVVLMLGMFSLPIAIIRARPYDDSDVRAFLAPAEGCFRACFMGIQPGQTTAEDALAVLEGHDWVADVEIVQLRDQRLTTLPDFGGLSWEWTGQQPALIDARQRGTIEIYASRAGRGRLPTHITLGDLWLVMGQPDRRFLFLLKDHVAQLEAVYADLGLVVTATWRCPADAWTIWHTGLTVGASTAGVDSLPFRPTQRLAC